MNDDALLVPELRSNVNTTGSSTVRPAGYLYFNPKNGRRQGRSHDPTQPLTFHTSHFVGPVASDGEPKTDLLPPKLFSGQAFTV